MEKRKIRGGVYLVVDPSAGIEAVLPRVQEAIAGGIDVLQVWNHWAPQQNRHRFIEAICTEAHAKAVPVLVNEAWELVKTTPLDGVHFDALPADLAAVRQAIGRPFVCGITCGNNLDRVRWAARQQLDYISFCSLFPSPSAGACEIVSKETVKQARQMTSMPIFLAGGITLENLPELAGTGLNGVALISAIMKSDNARAATRAFKNKLQTVRNEKV